MKVLVTGGSGFVGREILWCLQQAGHAIRLFSRRARTDALRQLAYRHRAELVAASFDEPESLVAAALGCDAVIHLAGIISEAGRNTFERVHVGFTRAMLAAASAAGVPRFVQMSALGTRPDARARYHQTKWEAEELVRQSGLDWTIFRPSVIYGRDDGFVNLLAKIARWSPVVPVFGAGRNQLQPVAIEDVAHAFVQALSAPASIGRTYDLCGTEVFTMSQVWRTILQITRRRRWVLRVPMPLARLQALMLEGACAILRRPSPLTRDQLLMLEEDNTGDPGPAAAEFSIPVRSFAEGIARYVR